MEAATIQTITEKPLFDPTYLNIEYVFNRIYNAAGPIWDTLTNPHTWSVIGVISVCLSILFIFIIIFSLVRLIEIQIFDAMEIEHEINHALAKDKETDRTTNPRWKYIQTLIDSPNESDWRISILEADTLLEESFKERDIAGDTMAELLEEAKTNGYPNIQGAWDAHIIRNKIAHEGQDFPLSQIEGRRVIKLYQNIFEDLKVI